MATPFPFKKSPAAPGKPGKKPFPAKPGKKDKC